jgi:hypothetical protein
MEKNMRAIVRQGLASILSEAEGKAAQAVALTVQDPFNPPTDNPREVYHRTLGECLKPYVEGICLVCRDTGNSCFYEQYQDGLITSGEMIKGLIREIAS